MGIENILDSINKDLEKSITLKDNEILKRWETHHRLLQSVETLEQLIIDGILDKDKQPILDHVKEIAHTIRPTNRLDYYK